ncbi:MAG: hypothetical protein KGM47_02575 [Acidobacteriota bacterium]|nr:hypothetical protein [Acidobacteriota bacterium]
MMPSEISTEIEKTELETVLASGLFARSPNLLKMLRYIGSRHLEGQEDAIKEYSIGVEALGRPPDFDPKKDSIVRVEAVHLREKLRRYYETEGVDHPVVISLHVGHYIPQFHHRSEAGVASAHAALASTLAWSPDNSETQEMSAAPPPEISNPPNSMAAALPPFRGRMGGWKWRLTLTLILIAAGAGIWAVIRPVRGKVAREPVSTVSPQTAAASMPAALSQGNPVRILSGYSKGDHLLGDGEAWGPDRYYSGGRAIAEPQVFISRDADPGLFETAREGEFSYNIPLKSGTYELRLYFVETTYGPGTQSGGGENSRIFSIDLNNKPLLTNFDIYSDAGGSDIADERVFTNVSPAADGELHLSFIKGVSDPILNALEIFPSAPGEIQPVRIVAQQNPFTDSAGHLWKPDRYFMRGRLATSAARVQGTRDPGLYTEERYGNFSYAIPVAKGRYAVTLYFAETYFGPDNLGGGGVGLRLFDVDCNGVALLRDFDVFQQAGGDNRALIRTFHGLKPNAQGKLLLSFIPEKNYASVQAIEVTEESH